jgi:glycosyltransferase involved in cell wall biosynthesis
LCAEGHRLAGPAAARLGLPAVWWRMLTPRGRPYEHAAAAIPVAAVACPTPAAAAVQRGLTPGVPVVVIPPGIDAAAVSARRGSGRALRVRLAPGSGPLVGIVGRLDPAKGQDDFLRAAARVATERPDARFAVVGGAILGHEGDLEARLRALAAELGLGERVTLAGHVADALPWLDALDVAVVASHHEAFGLVCAEALALGVPVVATATDGPAAILRGGRDGLLVPARDPAALAAAIARLLADRTLAAAFAAAGPARAAELDDRATALAMAALLERVSAAPRAAAGSGGALAVPAAPA